MAYIFTETLVDAFNVFIYVSIFVENLFNYLLVSVSNVTPYFIKYTIGYCHFFYQLVYGFGFYIYFYRRYRAKKTNNWKSFYNNSILNWLLFNTSIFNKFIFNKTFLIYIKNTINQLSEVIIFITVRKLYLSINFNKLVLWLSNIRQQSFVYIWTPIFKRSSYIWFTTFLKRFTKRK